MRTRDVRVEGPRLHLDGQEILRGEHPIHRGVNVRAWHVTPDGKTLVSGDARGELTVWDTSAEPKLLWASVAIPGSIEKIAITPDRSHVFVLFSWALWGACFDAFVRRGEEWKSAMHSLHLAFFSGRIEFDNVRAVLWKDPQLHWRLSMPPGDGSSPVAVW